MKFGVVVFPGSNCDHDAFYAISEVLHQPVEFIWHQSEDLAKSDAIILPGGFAHGDYLRTGAIARFSPVMKPVEKFAKSGGLVLGICNGFQILLEAGLLPGAMMRNVLTKRLTIRGFIVSDFAARHGDFLRDMSGWVREGKVKHKEFITEGLDSAPAAFMGLLKGANFGKQLVRVGPDRA